MATKMDEIKYLADAGRVLREYVETFPVPEQLFIEERPIGQLSGMKLIAYIPRLHFDIGVHIPSEGGFFRFEYWNGKTSHRLNTPLPREGISLEMQLRVEEVDALFTGSEREWEFERKLGGNKELARKAGLVRGFWDRILRGKPEVERKRFTAENFDSYRPVTEDFKAMGEFFGSFAKKYFPERGDIVHDQPYTKVPVNEVDRGLYYEKLSLMSWDMGKYNLDLGYLQRRGMSVARLEEELGALKNVGSDFGLSVSIIIPEQISHQDFLAHVVSPWMVSKALSGSKTETVEQHQYFKTGDKTYGMVKFFLASYDLALNADFPMLLQWIDKVHKSAEEYLKKLYEPPRS